MAKNFVQVGNTIQFTATTAVESGDLVQVGDVMAVAISDVAAQAQGVGVAEGVFLLPKLRADDMAVGKKVYLEGDKVQLANSASEPYVGVVWEAAGTSDDFVPVKINA
ncbi:DUF2190 family protein [Edwardsiella ictaluri]|uniref:DUF2190 family protein n=1 Tax=Edwardsiella ictaluri TaxID=67780 RepID=A0ABY8GDM0_EDWIC|nr:capsid cement protein [Edwardsiella ictaluri]ELV7527149.1 DUF2190 family protein [Edwardsiella ictaluri]KMQ79319.1 recombinase RecA [Edwardsiella ictaluri]KOO55865.1 recombinase RecA [Edwardsiella ictaluri]WFN95540.1 DUF2190 family protein [Edwardsiella ictaluri]